MMYDVVNFIKLITDFITWLSIPDRIKIVFYVNIA